MPISPPVLCGGRSRALHLASQLCTSAAILALVACGGSGGPDGSGGSNNTGGATGGRGGRAGGASGTGGTSNTGGTATAGANGSGGSNNTGGATGGGGTGGTTTGGSAQGGAASGGSNAGGRATGGTPGVGGGSAGATSLSAKYADLFPIGAAVDSQSYMTHAPLLKKHFNSLTPENEMKFEALEKSENNFTYGAADTLVSYAMTNGMKVRGHTLVWHSQNPSWVFTGSGGSGTASKEVLLARMKNHITKVMKHFQGKVYVWDVVNEAIMEDGSYRDANQPDDKKSRWYEILGESYIAEAFKAAHEADPNAKLFYNDFYDYIPTKQMGIYNMLKKLLAAGVPVHGVGMQCHFNIEPSTTMTNQAFYQDVPHMEDAIKLYASLGIEVQVTELDLSLYIPGVTYTSDTFYTAATFTDALKMKQAARYAQFFELFRKYKSAITSVTFWGIADDNTWLSEFTSGRKDFPLLFDNNHNAKPAYWSVVGF